MKKFLAIFLILSFVLNAGGYVLIYAGIQHSLKNYASKKINSGMFASEYTIITFSTEEMKTGVHGLILLNEKEFLYKGKMYDIVNAVQKNDSVYFYCLQDKDEDKLNLTFNKSIDKNAGDPDKKSAAEKLSRNIITEALTTGLLFHYPKTSDNNFSVYAQSSFVQNFPDVTTPPPDSSYS